jgi:hypothetical protein
LEADKEPSSSLFHQRIYLHVSEAPLLIISYRPVNSLHIQKFSIKLFLLLLLPAAGQYKLEDELSSYVIVDPCDAEIL